MKTIAKGAEATIDLFNNKIIKKRFAKSYRISEIDSKIRTRRTKSESKILLKANKIINTPKVLEVLQQDYQIILECIKGKKLSQYLDSLKNKKVICNTIGKQIAKLHDAEIIHGDLTTSNMILKNKKVYFIDFGLGFVSKKIEDKAVDLHLLKQALEAKHYKDYKQLWKAVEQGYKNSKESKKTLERLKAVEKRGRYKH